MNAGCCNMFSTIESHARKIAAVVGVLWVVSGLSWGYQETKMRDLLFPLMGETDIWGVGMGKTLCINWGHSNMILNMQKHSWKMRLRWGYFGLNEGSNEGLGPQICHSGSLGIGEIDWCKGMVIGMNWGCHNIILTIQNHAWENVAVLRVFLVVLEL